MRRCIRVSLLWSATMALALPAVAAELAAPLHLTQAVVLLNAITPDETDYQHQSGSIVWPGTPGTTHAECRTDCSGLIDALLKRSYHLSDEQLAGWLKAKRPLARHYHAAIAEGRGWQRVATVTRMLPGDLLAIQYPAGSENTGHMMLAADVPRRRQPTAPLREGTEQWEVSVIDSSSSGHGPTDTRMHADHTSGNGLGRGVLRLYTDPKGAVAGYSWSTSKSSKFVDRSINDVLIGRLQPDFVQTVKAGR